MLSRAINDAKKDSTDSSDHESESDGDYSVYECPGLAPAGDLEVKNPLFDEYSAASSSQNLSPPPYTAISSSSANKVIEPTTTSSSSAAASSLDQHGTPIKDKVENVNETTAGKND